MRPLLPLASALALPLECPAHAADPAALQQCVDPYYQGQLTADAAFQQCAAALRSTAMPDRYWTQDRALARWRIKAGRVVWLALQSMLSRGIRPKEQEFSWFVGEMKGIAESKAVGKKYTSRAYMVVGGIEGLITKYYRSGLGKKGIGKESFRAVRSATLVDPENKEFWNLEAWMTYGRALIEICTGPAARMAAYVLDIDRKAEVERTLDALQKLQDMPNLRNPARDSLNRELTSLREVQKSL